MGERRGGRRARSRRVLVAALRRRPREVVLFGVWSAVEAAPVLVFGRAVAGATDAFLAHHVAAALGWLGVLVGAALVGALGAARAYRPLAAIVEPFRDALVRHVVHGAIRESVRTGRRGDAAVARLTQQVEIVRDTFAGLLTIVQGFVFTLVGALIGLLSLMPVTLVLVVPPVVVGLGLFLGLVARSITRQRELILAEEAIAESATALAGGLRDITACGSEETMAAEAGRLIDAQATTARSMARLAAGRTVALAVGGRLPLLLLLGAAPWLVRHGATPGVVLGSLTYVLQGLSPALGTIIRGLGGSGLRLAVTLDRVMEAAEPGTSADFPVHTETPCQPTRATSDTPNEATRTTSKTPAQAVRAAPEPLGQTVLATPGPPGEGARVVSEDARRVVFGGAVARGGGDLRLCGVSFAYGASAAPVVDGLSLRVVDGDHLAVVGPSGIGKSTLSLLAAGLLTPSGGTVTLGGVPADEVDPALRALIPQEAYVFGGTLRENLCYLRPGASDHALDRAVDAVGLRALAVRLGGYGAAVDPAALSAGERQLVALVRAYLSPARLVMLDEATCHLDAVAEERAERAFMARPGSLVVIAHRMTSARRARRILVLDGTRAWLGAHEDLLTDCEPYRELHGHWAAPPPHPQSPERHRRGGSPASTPV